MYDYLKQANFIISSKFNKAKKGIRKCSLLLHFPTKRKSKGLYFQGEVRAVKSFSTT